MNSPAWNEYIPWGNPEEIASKIAEAFGESISAKLDKIFAESRRRFWTSQKIEIWNLEWYRSIPRLTQDEINRINQEFLDDIQAIRDDFESRAKKWSLFDITIKNVEDVCRLGEKYSQLFGYIWMDIIGEYRRLVEDVTRR